MLSRLRMTVDDCIKEYETLGHKIFGQPRKSSLFGILKPKYSGRAFKELIEDVSVKHSQWRMCMPYRMDEADDDLCRWFVETLPRLRYKNMLIISV